MRGISFGSLSLVIFIALLSLPTPAESGIALGFEYAEVSREHEAIEDGEAYAISIAGDVGNSLVQFKYSAEESPVKDFEDFALTREEMTLTWHWNERTDKANYIGAAFGFFSTSYEVVTFSESLEGIQFGFTGTKYISGQSLFLTGQAWMKLPVVGDDEEAGSEERGTYGFEFQVGIGVVIGQENNFAVILGARRRNLDLDGLFPVNDDRDDVFIGARLFFQ